jgi:hypothetical protein
MALWDARLAALRAMEVSESTGRETGLAEAEVGDEDGELVRQRNGERCSCDAMLGFNHCVAWCLRSAL